MFTFSVFFFSCVPPSEKAEAPSEGGKEGVSAPPQESPQYSQLSFFYTTPEGELGTLLLLHQGRSLDILHGFCCYG